MECLRVAIVRAESQRSVVKADGWNTRQAGRDHKAVLGVARPELVQDGGTEYMDVTNLEVGSGGSERIQEAAREIGSREERVSRTGPVELGEEAILLAEVIVQPQGCFIAI